MSIQSLCTVLVRRLANRSQEGASAVEYGFLISGIAVIAMIGIFLFGDQVQVLFDSSCDDINTVVNGASC